MRIARSEKLTRFEQLLFSVFIALTILFLVLALYSLLREVLQDRHSVLTYFSFKEVGGVLGAGKLF